MTDLGGGDPPQIGQFRILRRLGVGGMGVVYLAEGRHGRVALKVVRPELGDDPQFRIRFRREVQASFRVQGRTTVTLVDFDTEGEQPWMAVEYIDGPPLSEFVPASGPLDTRRQFALAVALADALLEIHDHGLVHRDLKPDNVLLPAEGPKVIDLGIAAAADAVRLTAVGSVLGAPGWLSPEQVETGNATAASDIFAWGCTVGYAASGRLPFGEGTPNALLYRVLSSAPDIDFGRLAPPLRSLVAAATERDPASRPDSAKLLNRLLERAELPGSIKRETSVRDVLLRDWQGRALEKPKAPSEPPAAKAPAAKPPVAKPPAVAPAATPTADPDQPPTVIARPPAARPPAARPPAARPPAARPPAQPPPARPAAAASPPAARFDPAAHGVGPLLGAGPFAGGSGVPGAYGSPPASTRTAWWRRPAPMIGGTVGVLALIVVLVLVLTGAAGAEAPTSPTGLQAIAANDAVDLRWQPVTSADGYRVLSDGLVVAERVGTPAYRVALGSDTASHRYAVVALGAGKASPPSGAVASAALGPWGVGAPAQAEFPRIVPPRPKAAGGSGQTCETTPPQLDKQAKGIVSCSYPNAVYLEVLSYGDNGPRDVREGEIRKVATDRTTWSTSGGGPGGNLYLGKDNDGPWRWWTFNERPGFAMYASWPKHTAEQLKTWWTDAPF